MCLFITKDTNKIINKIFRRKDKRIIIKLNQITPNSNKKAYLSASATVEASLVIPLFIYAVMFVMYLIQIANIKQQVSTAMYNNVRKMSQYAYVYSYFKDDKEDKDDSLAKESSKEENFEKSNSSQSESVINNSVVSSIIKNGISDVLAKELLIDELGEKFADNNGIEGGNSGISLIQSKIVDDDSKIKLVVSYKIKNPFDIFGIGKTSVEESFTTRAWLGEDNNSNQDGQEETQIVYITQTGEVYHKDRACTYLNLSIHSVSKSSIPNIRNKSGGKYYKCEYCCTDDSDTYGNQDVYVTDYGECYHLNMNCSKLKRTVLEVPIDKVGDRRSCSRCGGQ